MKPILKTLATLALVTATVLANTMYIIKDASAKRKAQ